MKTHPCKQTTYADFMRFSQIALSDFMHFSTKQLSDFMQNILTKCEFAMYILIK